MKTIKEEYIREYQFDSNDLIIGYFLSELEISHGIGCQKSSGPVCRINDRDFVMKSRVFDIPDIEPLDFMFPIYITQDSFDVHDKTNEILSHCLRNLRDYLVEERISFLIFYALSFAVHGKTIRCIVRYYAE